jgi:hypothetical protein
MRIDWYTKGVLTVIAVLLAMIVFKQYVSPDTIARADGPFAGVQYSGPNAYSFFDTKTGQLSLYNDDGIAVTMYRFTSVGSPLTKVK